MQHMKLSDFDYELPESQIAYHPAERRDQSRLLVLDRRRMHLSIGISATCRTT